MKFFDELNLKKIQPKKKYQIKFVKKKLQFNFETTTFLRKFLFNPKISPK